MVQLGDAAHAFLPTSGNGATQAIEDAVCLAECLRLGCADGKGKAGIELALWIHNTLRWERVGCVQLIGVVNQMEKDRGGGGKPRGFGGWLWRHDVEEYARENFAQVKSYAEDGKTWVNTNVPKGYVYESWTVQRWKDMMERGEQIVLDGEWD